MSLEDSAPDSDDVVAAATMAACLEDSAPGSEVVAAAAAQTLAMSLDDAPPDSDAEAAAAAETMAACIAAATAAAETTRAAMASHVSRLQAVLAEDGITISDVLAARFLSANDNAIPKAAAQYRAQVAWREREGVDELGTAPLEAEHHERLLDLHAFMPAVLDGLDHEGRPVAILYVGALDPARLRKAGVTRQMVVRRYIQFLERIQAATDAAPNPYGGHLLILDVHAGEALMARCSYFLRAVPLLSQLSRIGQQNYPELAGQLAIVRGPHSWALKWGIDRTKQFMDQKTASKFTLFQGPSHVEALGALTALLPRSTSLPAALQAFPWPLPRWPNPEQVAPARPI